MPRRRRQSLSTTASKLVVVKSETHGVHRRRRRISEFEQPLPRLRSTAITAMEAFLQQEYNSRRTPTTAAPLFVLMVELDKLNRPFPTRARVAKHIGVTSPFGIDCAIRVALERGLIVEQTDKTKRTSPEGDRLTRQMGPFANRRYIPINTLIDVVDYSLGGGQRPAKKTSAKRNTLVAA